MKENERKCKTRDKRIKSELVKENSVRDYAVEKDERKDRVKL